MSISNWAPKIRKVTDNKFSKLFRVDTYELSVFKIIHTYS